MRNSVILAILAALALAINAFPPPIPTIKYALHSIKKIDTKEDFHHLDKRDLGISVGVNHKILDLPFAVVRVIGEASASDKKISGNIGSHVDVPLG